MKRQLNRFKYIWFMVLMMTIAVLVMLSGFTLPTAGALAVLITAILSDSATTYACLKAGGREGNPIIAFLMRKITVLGTFMVFWALCAVIIYFRILNSEPASQTAVAMAYWLVPMNNLMVLRGLRKKRAQIAVS